MHQKGCQFHIGQVVTHSLFGYKGAIYDVDAEFMLTDEWYKKVAKSSPPKDQPWYHILVDGVEHSTYVAERNLKAVLDPTPIAHPLINEYFEEFNGISYNSLSKKN